MTETSLILLHGWGMNATVFEALRAQLPATLSICNPALPGYPGSPWRADPDFDGQLEQMAVELPAGHLLGWSLGGLYAIELGLRYPQKFSALTLIACNPCFVRQTGWECAVDASLFDSFDVDLATDWQRSLRRFIALQMQGESRSRQLTRSLWQDIVNTANPDLAVLRSGLDILRHLDLRAALARLPQAVTLVLGERDLLVPIALAQQITDLAPRIRVESVAGAAHAPFMSHPAEVAALL